MPLEDLTPQLRTRLRRMERIVGLFVALAVLVLLSGFGYYLSHTAARKGWFLPKVRYFTFVESAEGLQVGDPVLLMGFSVGEITVIEAQPPFTYYNVFVGLEVRKPYYGYIWTDSKARIAATSFLGGRRLELTKGQTGVPTVVEENGQPAEILVNGARVPIESVAQGVGLEPQEDPALAERAQQLVALAEEALPQLLERVQKVLDNTAQLTAEVSGLAGQARPLVDNLTVISRNLRNPEGSLGRWLLTSELRTELERSFDNVNANLVELRRTLEDLAGITASLRAEVEANPLVSEISDLVVETDELVQGLKRHWLLRGSFAEPPPQRTQPKLEPLLELPEPRRR